MVGAETEFELWLIIDCGDRIKSADETGSRRRDCLDLTPRV